MISTNRVQPAVAGPDVEPEKLRVLTTNNIKPREFPDVARKMPDVDKRPTRKVSGMLTTIDLEEKKRADKRARAAAERRAVAAKIGPVTKPALVAESRKRKK